MDSPAAKPMRIGVLGAGSHSRAHHGSAVKELRAAQPNLVSYAAICDLDRARAEAYAAEYGFDAVFDDLDTMIAETQLDALAAITPMPLTCSLGCDLLARGLPLLLEKPPGISVAEAEQLAATARETGTPHMVSFNRRFSPALTSALDWLRATGREDAVRLIEARMTRVRRKDNDFMLGTGIHLVDTVLSLLKATSGRQTSSGDRRPPQSSMPGSLRGGPRRPDAVGGDLWSPDTIQTNSVTCGDVPAWQALLDCGDVSAALTVAPDAGAMDETYRLAGNDFSITIDVLKCTMAVVENGEQVAAYAPPEGASEAFTCGAVAENAAFIEAAAGRGMYEPTLEDALASMRVCDVMQGGAV